MVMSKKYSICKRCVLENKFINDIYFNKDGICNYCTEYMNRAKNEIMSNDPKKLDELISQIKNSGSKDYDCIIGVSGGIDSSYVAIKSVEMGLKPLAIHLDNGWNTELAVNNIEKLMRKLNLDLITHVLDWEEFRDLQLSFLKASVINVEIPTDHAINALLFKTAAKQKIKYILSGSNVLTEAIMPEEYGGYDSYDWKHIKSIHKIFGSKNLSNYPYLSTWHWGYYSFIKRIKFVPFLNYIIYNKKNAAAILVDKFDWKLYPEKHYESFFTKLFQAYILPTKFNIDKRRAHFSCLINAGQMDREEALKKLEAPLYDLNELSNDTSYFNKKMEISMNDFEELMNKKPIDHLYYPSSYKLYSRMSDVIKFVKNYVTLRA